MGFYPEPKAPLLTKNPDWACLEVTINECPDADDCVPASIAHTITSLTLHNLDTTLLDLSSFSCCSRLKDLVFGEDTAMDSDHVAIMGIEKLPKTCCTLRFQDFMPYMPNLSQLNGWRCEWGRGLCTSSLDEACEVVVKLPGVDAEYFRLTRIEQCLRM